MNTIKSAFILISVLFSIQVFSQESQELANAYFEKGEYEKAYDTFKALVKDEALANSIHKKYLQTLYKLKKWDEAEKFLRKQIRNNPQQIVYKADNVELLKLTNKEEEAEKQLEQLISEAVATDANVYALQDYYYQLNQYEVLISLLEKAKKSSKEPSKFAIQLARAYLFNGNKLKMLDEIMAYGNTYNNASYVKQTIQDNFKEEEELKQLEQVLYTKIQEEPNSGFYSDLLIWHFVQQKKFRNAFTQARALDRRLRLEGQKIFELASIAYQNKDFKSAAMMYEYVMTEYPNGDFYSYARRWKIQSKEEMVKTTYPIDINEIRELIKEYEQLFSDVGSNGKTLEAIRNVALLKAFYLDEHDVAIKLLEQTVEIAGGNQVFKDECKIDLGDIYVLKNEPWEATLLYLQVEKSQKEEKLGEIAKLRNAKNYYYRGDFELAKEVLDILKKATTREIANDAMQLSLLIQDNTGLDTTVAPMQEFAKVDLMVFQNKNEQAVKALTEMFETYKLHYLADEILYLKATTNIKMNKIDEAITDLEKIIKDYKFDILADDALFTLAKLTEENKNNPTEAMRLYRELLKEYPGSIFGVEARKRFRIIRGDYIN